MATDKVRAETDGPIGRMTFDNPGKHNAVSLEMWDAAERILSGFVDDAGVRVIVITGAGGKAFVSGADISKFEEERATAEAVARYNERTRRVFTRMDDIPKPIIAMIDGYCIGGGLALALSCDVRICSEKSRFGLPAARLGLGYPFEGLRRLVDAVGPANTKDIVFTARRFGADEARAMGLVQYILPAAKLAPFVRDYARTIAGNAPLTVAAMKGIVGEVMKDPEVRDMELCRRLVDVCFASEDYVEGRRAFMEKREPSFSGH